MKPESKESKHVFFLGWLCMTTSLKWSKIWLGKTMLKGITTRH